jgi:hypothetical protein
MKRGDEMGFIAAAKARYYSKDQSEEILRLVHENLNPSIRSLSHEFLCAFHDILTKYPCCNWDKPVFEQCYRRLSDLMVGTSVPLVLDEKMMEHFLIGYNTYRQITDIINDYEQLNDGPWIKNRLYRIPTYNAIVEGCLTNLFRFILLVLDQYSSKDYASQSNLDPICKALQKNGFDKAVKGVDVNIRNAINHGGLFFMDNGNEIELIYNESGKVHRRKLLSHEFNDIIERVYDVASGILLSICAFLNDKLHLFNIDRNCSQYISFSLFAMELSLPSIRCQCVNALPDNRQLNLDIYVESTELIFLHQTAIELAIIAYNRYTEYESYFIHFLNERLSPLCWMRFSNQQIHDITYKVRDVCEVLLEAERIIGEASTEDVDLQEIKYFRFPNYTGNGFKIRRVEDSSVDNRKRLKASLFIGDEADKENLINLIWAAINWLKVLKNPASPAIPKKHGTMEADSVYINVYRNDLRQGRGLFQNNENFVCFVDYNIDGVTYLKHGGLPESLWNQFYHEQLGQIRIAWREGKYISRKRTMKVGQNDPCPSGSGKKFKKCCCGNGKYDEL